MAFKLITGVRINKYSRIPHILLTERHILISAKVALKARAMVLFEVDRKKEIIKFTLSDSPCAIRLQPLGLRGKCIAMNRHRFKEMGMPLGYYNLKHQTLKTFTFQKQAPSS